jgi:hypothetical protein
VLVSVKLWAWAVNPPNNTAVMSGTDVNSFNHHEFSNDFIDEIKKLNGKMEPSILSAWLNLILVSY